MTKYCCHRFKLLAKDNVIIAPTETTHYQINIKHNDSTIKTHINYCPFCGELLWWQDMKDIVDEYIKENLREE